MEQKIDLKQIERVLDELAKVKGSLITILQKTQDIYGYLPKDAIIYISERTGIAESEIMGVATFYTQFRLAPVGKYLIMLCQGTACHVNSSELILQTIKDELGIEDGETTDDGLFSLKCVACLGCCSLSPVMMINESTYGSLTPEKTKKILEGGRMMKIVVGEGSCGIAAGAEKVRQALLKQDLNGAKLTIAGCIGMCYLEPIVDIYEDNQEVKRLVRVTENDAEKISEYAKTGDESFISSLLVSDEDKEFLNKQTRIALRRCGIINPDEIDDFVNADGYTAIKKVLTSMTPEDVIEVIKTSGLAGRGGAGFPTWFKWNAARQSEGEEKYLICNADEGDPGSFMNIAVIESDPHTLIEGMLIGAYAIGAKNAVVYVRAEYPLAIKRLERAIEQATAAGYLGDNILGTDFSCKMTIKAGAGAFVCGEETALIESLEGHRGMPRLKPPFPAQSGYWKKPSNINNVETFANVSWIINNGGEAFAAMGTEGSKGTKVFAVTGKVKRSGLVEIPMGKTLRDVIFDIGGGMKGDKAFKAVQMGGPSGGCIPADLIDTVIDYKALGATGAIMGSGGMVVMDEGTCMVGMAKFFLDFTAKESCGKCIHCRIGTKRMLEILTRITEGNGQPGDVELLEELCYGIKDGALCGLGQTAPNPVLTTIKYFRNEYDAHINDKKCPAGECSSLIEYSIDKDKCKGCTLCARNCPVGAISGEVKSAHTIDINKCIKCGKCIATCRFGAVVRK